MALFKVSKGLKANLPSAKTEGYCWYTTDDSLFYIDYKDKNGTLQRKALNAKDAETLTGASLSTILNSSDVEIPTSKAVLDALDGKVDKVDGKSLSTEDYTTEEKNKLSRIESGANKTTVDGSLSSTSTNPVQNKVVNSALQSYLPLIGGTLSGNLTLQKSMYITSESGTRAILFQNSNGKQHNIALVGNDGLQDVAFRIINDNNTDDKKYVFAYNDATDTIIMRPAVSCGTSLSVSGNISGQYITGTWLQTTDATDLSKTAKKVAVLDDSGWVYYRTPAELKSDMGVVTPKDYVIERGTSSSWHYEKWNSGKLELWRQMTSNNLGTNGQVGGWYYRTYTIALPSNLLKSVQDVQCNCHWGDGVSFASGHADTANFNATYFSNKNGGAGTFWHRITGTWK